MTKAAHFEARRWGYRQTKEGTVISFLVHPNDVSAELATAPLGTRYMVAFAQIGDDEQAVEKPAEQEKTRKPFHEMSRAQQAGILCADERFQKWLGVTDEEGAADEVRLSCRVGSRGALDQFPSAAAKWDGMVTSYRQAVGLETERR